MPPQTANPEPPTCNLQPATFNLALPPENAILPSLPAAPDAEVSGPLPPADPSQARRNGKIPHLPQAQQNLINQLLDEGCTYEVIIRKLADQGVTLNLKNLSDWFHGGYQDELQARERRALLLQSQQRLLDLARKDDAPDL